jgi:leucyl aminopeptidase
VGAIACAENMPDGKAYKPSDIVTTYSGQTVEVFNTDAEGRMVLCDTLSYIIDQYKPKHIIDIATLTGAVITSLGDVASGLFSNTQALSEALQNAAQQSCDYVWPFPMWPAYQELLKSELADMKHANLKGGAQSITAACFLERFVADTPWAHIDIAGTAWQLGNYMSATGRPISLLTQHLINQCHEAI